MEHKTWSADDERRVSRALGNARDALLRLGRRPLLGSDVVFETMKDMAYIHIRWRVSSGPRKLKSAWLLPAIDEGSSDAYTQMLIDLAAGTPLEQVFGFQVEPSPQEMSMMESVNTIFKDCLIGKDKARDWKILHMVSFPVGTLRLVGKYMGLSKDSISDRKNRQCYAIWNQVNRLLPPASVGTKGTVWESQLETV